MAMRSGPSAWATSNWRPPPAEKGRRAIRRRGEGTLISSGFSNRRRAAAADRFAAGAAARRRPAKSRSWAGIAALWASGIWVSWGTKRSTRASPWRTESRSARYWISRRAFSLLSKLADGGCASVRSAWLPAGSGRNRNRDPADRSAHPVFPAAAAAPGPASREAPPSRRSDAPHRAIGAEESGFQPAQAQPALFQHPAQALRQAEQRRGDGVCGDDGFGETLLGHQVGQGPARIDRLVMLAQQDFQRGDESLCRNAPPVRRAARSATWAMVLRPARRRARR